MAPLAIDLPVDQGFGEATFAMLILAGHICFPCMLLCIFISGNPCSKNYLFLHFCFAWVVHCVAFSILFYIGDATGPEPAFAPCITQAVLVYISPVLESSFICALFYHLCSSVGTVLNSNTRLLKLPMKMLIAGPYIISLVPVFSVLIVATNRPEDVYRSGNYYCAIWFRPLTYINAAIVAIILCMAMFLQCRIGFLLYRNRLVLKQVKVQGFDLLHLFIRLSFFLLVTVAGMGMVLVAMVDATDASRIMFQAALPLLAFLTFGTRLSFYRLNEKPAEINRPPAQLPPPTTKVIA